MLDLASCLKISKKQSSKTIGFLMVQFLIKYSVEEKKEFCLTSECKSTSKETEELVQMAELKTHSRICTLPCACTISRRGTKRSRAPQQRNWNNQLF